MSIFMYYEGVPGGQTADKNHHAHIDVDDLAWNVGRRITSQSGTRHDRESANVIIGDLTLTRRMDSASPYLFIRSCCGRGADVVITLTETGTGSGSNVYMTYTLKNALLSSYEVDAGGHRNARPTELLTLSFVDIEMKYTPYDDAGNALAPVAVGFDASNNEKH